LIDEQASIVVNAPIVVSETRDGEAIIMHHGSGAFFDTSGSGAFLWGMIERGASLATIAGATAGAYRIDAEVARLAVERFLETLLEHDLIVVGGAPSAAGGAWTAPAVGSFVEPVLGVHTDLADMLLLDPIHEVDEAGWPLAAS
jgi:hypothetical protein